MIIDRQMIITGRQLRKSQKTGNQYILYSILNENGETFNCMSEKDFDIVPLEKYMITFDLSLGRYVTLKILDIQVDDYNDYGN